MFSPFVRLCRFTCWLPFSHFDFGEHFLQSHHHHHHHHWCNSISVRTTTYSPGNSRSSFKLSAVQLQELDLHFSHIQVCTICKLWWAQTACKSLAQLGALSLLSSVYARWNRSLGHSCFPRLQMHLLTFAQGFKNLWGKAKFSCLSMSAENNRMSKK